jgi:hypothetical protein
MSENTKPEDEARFNSMMDTEEEGIDYFGGCPECGSNDACLNIGRAHWCFCEDHKTRWCAGANLFSSWKSEDEGIWLWRANWEKLEEYREVESLTPDAWNLAPGGVIADDEFDPVT